LGETGYERFMEYNNKWLHRSIRVNLLKISPSELIKRMPKWSFSPVPWCAEGFFMEQKTRKDIGNTSEFQLGYYYGQEAASMIPPVVLDPQPGDVVLDMCASPGSKSTQMAAMMNNKGVLVANDIKGSRLAALGINMQRMGVTNAIITRMQGHWFNTPQFDRVLLDAPCSGTGNIRKSPKILQVWNPDGIKRLAGLQKGLIKAAFEALKPKGVLVYSTCSVEPDENEGVLDFLLSRFPNARLEGFELKLKRSEPIIEPYGYNPEIKKALRIWPQDNDTGGFFVARIRKT